MTRILSCHTYVLAKIWSTRESTDRKVLTPYGKCVVGSSFWLSEWFPTLVASRRDEGSVFIIEDVVVQK